MIQYKNGDLFEYISDKHLDPSVNIIIPHITNDIGAWGSGFVVPLGKQYPKAQDSYIKSYVDHDNANIPMLGNCQIVDCGCNTYVANMCAQTGILGHSTGDRNMVNMKPIRYAALVDCMRNVASFADANSCQIHCPKFGSDRAGGNWYFIEELIQEIWEQFSVTVYIL